MAEENYLLNGGWKANRKARRGLESQCAFKVTFPMT
jgi:hypothetical protein